MKFTEATRVQIDYVDISEDEFNRRMAEYKNNLSAMFAESHRLEAEIMQQLDSLKFNK
jgi:type I restriction enzyme M protein